MDNPDSVGLWPSPFKVTISSNCQVSDSQSSPPLHFVTEFLRKLHRVSYCFFFKYHELENNLTLTSRIGLCLTVLFLTSTKTTNILITISIAILKLIIHQYTVVVRLHILLLANTLSFSQVHQDFIPKEVQKLPLPLHFPVKNEKGETFNSYCDMEYIYIYTTR
jgi:hypothetical protein